MKCNFIFFLTFSFYYSLAQKPTLADVYPRIKQYYQQHPQTIEFLEYSHKNVLGFDTIRYNSVYCSSINGYSNALISAIIDSNQVGTAILCNKKNFYFIQDDKPEKIKYKKNELHYVEKAFEQYPTHDFENLEKRFGTVKLVLTINNKWEVITEQAQITLDTFTCRIEKITKKEYFEKKWGFTEFKFVEKKDSIVQYFKNKIEERLLAAENYSEVGFKKAAKKKIIPTQFEGTTFNLNNLVAYNYGALDTLKNDKYIIFDFFYHTCYPCHLMTGYILDWLPSVDTSKLMIVGVDPFDTGLGTKKFIAERKIKYPIIIGKQAKEIVRKYGISVFPTLILVAPNGTIKIVHQGMSKSFLKNAEDFVKPKKRN